MLRVQDLADCPVVPGDLSALQKASGGGVTIGYGDLDPTRPRKRPEAELQKQADDFLSWDGWRAIVTDPPRLRGLGVIEKGIPDRLYLRYEGDSEQEFHNWAQCISQALWIEWKAKGGQHGVDQIRWRKAERARGALVWVAREDFEPDYDSFVAFYRKSGLLRRAGL